MTFHAPYISLSFWISVTIPDSGQTVITDNGADTLTEDGTFVMNLSNNLLRAYIQVSEDDDDVCDVMCCMSYM